MSKVCAFICVGICFTFFYSCDSASSKEKVKYQLYYAQGELLYQARCSNCHQKSGTGLGLVYPPLAKSDYLSKNFDGIACLIRYGTRGAMTVNGQQFNQPMPGVPVLTELELAELTTYICNTWGNERGIVEFQQINKSLENCSR